MSDDRAMRAAQMRILDKLANRGRFSGAGVGQQRVNSVDQLRASRAQASQKIGSWRDDPEIMRKLMAIRKMKLATDE